MTAAKKRRCCSLQSRRINIYTVARIICQTVGGSGERGRWRKACQDQTSKCFVSFESIHAPLSLTWVFQVSHTCAPVGFRFLLTGESACRAPGFLFMLLQEDCWYEVSHSLWHPRSLVQHVQVVSHLHVRKKSKVEGSFHILINPAVDRRFICVKPLAWPWSPLSLLHSFSLLANLVSFSAFAYWPSWHQSKM